jgi:hypothetical protein
MLDIVRDPFSSRTVEPTAAAANIEQGPRHGNICIKYQWLDIKCRLPDPSNVKILDAL